MMRFALKRSPRPAAALLSGLMIACTGALTLPAQPASAQDAEPKTTKPKVVNDITVPEGFKVELLHETEKDEQGSWVSLCDGPDGTLFASAQYMKYGKGKNAQKRNTLYHLKPAAIGDPNAETTVIPQPIEINGAQGLCWAFGALYVMETGVGVQRVTDTNGDGLLDSKQLLVEVKGGGEHGTHAIVKTHDGKGLYLVAGNMTPMPKYDATRVPELWDEDQLLPRERDARGHAGNVMAPGGWIARMDPDGKNVTIICNGFRNQYDVAVAPNGELFTYDSDMEWDLGTPWYRPTRVNHVTSGAEFGWRNGSGKWPAYFEDSLASVVDIGPGSPVGVTFGTGANFPTKCQEALYILDWTYGTIYSIQMQADGATYTGQLKPFLYAKALPLTDVAIADDGAMYFTIGGRRTGSAFYRVTYVGDKDTTPPAVKPLTELAQLRKKIEELHKPGVGADQLGFVWGHLGHEDRTLRFAARVALEHMDPGMYIDRAKAEEDALTRTAAGLALARHKHPASLEVLLGAKPATDDTVTSLAWMRAVGVAFARGAQANAEQRQAILDTLDKLDENESQFVKTEIVRLKIYLKAPDAIAYGLDLMKSMKTEEPFWFNLAEKNDRYGAAIKKMIDNPPPSNQLGIAFMLRNVKDGWTLTQRQDYFSWLNLAAQSGGGNSYAGYIKNIRKQVVDTLTEDEKLALGSLTEEIKFEWPYDPVEIKGPGRDWSVAMATKLTEKFMKNRDFEKGAAIYHAVTCSQCHKVGSAGGAIGPDLTPAAGKFNVEEIMRAIIEPSHEVNDQYAVTEVVTKDGRLIVGKFMGEEAGNAILKPDPLKDATVKIPLDQIESKKLSAVSTMPAGLINSLSANELRDLTAFVLSGGDPKNSMFKQDKQAQDEPEEATQEPVISCE